MFIWDVDRIQVLVALRLRVPFSDWLLAVDCSQLLEAAEVPAVSPSHSLAAGGSLWSPDHLSRAQLIRSCLPRIIP